MDDALHALHGLGTLTGPQLDDGGPIAFVELALHGVAHERAGGQAAFD